MILRRGEAEVKKRGSEAKAAIDLEGQGKAKLSSGSAFLDHMLHSLSALGSFDLAVEAVGGLGRAEAIGGALGMALDRALGARRGIRRYGWAMVPMDDALAEVALDLGGRAYLVLEGSFSAEQVGDLGTEEIKPFLESLAVGGRLTLHCRYRGENDHHKAESLFKATGLALKMAAYEEGTEIPSTKGAI
jgi:imidazoleglycerol phosphate dehydratase HisB